MSWERLRTEGKGSGGKNFVKLKDGDSVIGVFRGEPHIFYKIYQDKVEYDEWAEGRNFRFRINFIVKEGDQYVAKIFEGGRRVADDVVAASEEYTLNSVFKISRKGSGKENTKYSVLFKSALEEEQLDKIKKVKLETLKFGKRAQVFDDQEPPPFTDDDIPAEEGEEPLPF